MTSSPPPPQSLSSQPPQTEQLTAVGDTYSPPEAAGSDPGSPRHRQDCHLCLTRLPPRQDVLYCVSILWCIHVYMYMYVLRLAMYIQCTLYMEIHVHNTLAKGVWQERRKVIPTQTIISTQTNMAYMYMYIRNIVKGVYRRKMPSQEPAGTGVCPKQHGSRSTH